MKWIALMVTAAALAAEPAKDDKERMQGLWTAVSVEVDGATQPEKKIARWTVRIDGDKIVARDGEELLDEMTAKLDPSAKPGAIDLTYTAGDQKGKTVKGIYKVDGETLTFCVAEAGKERPSEFKAPAGSDHKLLLFKRAKP